MKLLAAILLLACGCHTSRPSPPAAVSTCDEGIAALVTGADPDYGLARLAYGPEPDSAVARMLDCPGIVRPAWKEYTE